jgi:hypothetical protein
VHTTAKRHKARRAEGWRHPSVGRRFTIAAIITIVVGVLASGWLELLFPAGLILAVVAWFKGDKLGVGFILVLFFVVRLGMIFLALQKYG